MRKMRYDMFICLLIAAAFLFGIQAGGKKVIESRAQAAEEDKVIASSEIGGQANESITKVESISQMKENDRFTVEVDTDMMNTDFVITDGKLYNIMELPSGEFIFADVYSPSTQYIHEGDSFFATSVVYPVGQLVDTDISAEMLSQAKENGYDISAADCYVDMANGLNKKFDKDKAETVVEAISWVVFIVLFFGLHIVGVKLGLFPPFIPKKAAAEN